MLRKKMEREREKKAKEKYNNKIIVSKEKIIIKGQEIKNHLKKKFKLIV